MSILDTTPENRSFPSIESSASPLAPAFSPITPQQLLSFTSPSSPCLSTPQHTEHSNSNLAQAGEEFAPVSCSSPKPGVGQEDWAGFKVVMDNIDMNLKPRHQTFERQTRSVHYVNVYAALDRVDLSHCSTLCPNVEVSISSILPSDKDRKLITENFTVLAARILYASIPAFQEIPGLETSHISHVYSKEMNSRSKIVRLQYVIDKYLS